MSQKLKKALTVTLVVVGVLMPARLATSRPALTHPGLPETPHPAPVNGPIAREHFAALQKPRERQVRKPRLTLAERLQFDNVVVGRSVDAPELLI